MGAGLTAGPGGPGGPGGPERPRPPLGPGAPCKTKIIMYMMSDEQPENS